MGVVNSTEWICSEQWPFFIKATNATEMFNIQNIVHVTLLMVLSDSCKANIYCFATRPPKTLYPYLERFCYIHGDFIKSTLLK